MSRLHRIAAPLALGLLLALAPPAAFAKKAKAPKLPARPEQLVYPELVFEAPVADEHRHVLENGVVVYVVEDRRVPLVDVSIQIRVDETQEPAELTGLHAAAMELMGSAGGGGHDANWVEEEIAFLGARLRTGSGSYGGQASLQTLSKDLGHGLDILFGLLRDPAFQAERIDQWKRETLASMKERNDHPARIEGMEWRRLIYDDDYWRPSTAASVQAVDREALLDWHRRWVQPAHFAIAVSGDVETAAVLAELATRMDGWKGDPQVFSSPEAKYDWPAPGVYVLDKDVNQCRVRALLPGLDRDDPRWEAASLMNEVLGGGGMSSNLVNRVRTEEGLAYSVGSRFEEREFGPGLFFASLQTKSESTLYAMDLVVQELRRMAADGIDEQRLADAKSQLIEAFPTWFGSAEGRAGLFVDEELSGRRESDPRHYADLRERVAAVTVEQTRAVAAELLVPEKLVWLLVGDAKTILEPDAEHGVAVETFGPLTRVPLRDPLTQEPLGD